MSESDFAYFNLYTMYPVSTIEWFKIIMSVIGILGVILSAIVLLIVYFRSPPSMHRFKTYLLLYTFCNATVELTILLLKPVIIPIYFIVYPQGLLSPMSESTILIVGMIMLSSGTGILICFLCMLVERLFAMTNVAQPNIPFYRNQIYYTSFFGSIFMYVNIVLIYFIFIEKVFKSPEETTAIITQHIIGGDFLLSKQQVLISVNINKCFILIYLIGPFIILYLILFVIFFILCTIKIRRSMLSFSKKSRANHLMLFRCLVFQCVSMSILVFIPATSLIIGGLLGASPNFLIIPIIFVWSFPIFDNIVTLVTITPYRIFILNTVSKYKKKNIVAMVNSIHS